jgi:cell division protein FtsW
LRRLSAALASLDGGVVTAVTLLVAVGVVMLYSTTASLAPGTGLAPHFARQIAAIGVALGVAVLAALPSPRFWRRLAVPAWIGSVLLLLVTALLAPEVKGARRWLTLFGFTFQPGELARAATLVALAAALADVRERGRFSPRRLLRPAALVAVPIGFLVLQPDLGGALVLALLGGLLVFVAGVPLASLAGPGVIAASAASLFVALHPYARRRVTGFLDPWSTASDEGFQLVQSFVAFGSGGLLGRGLGDGRQKLDYLPEAHTDFILSVVAEEAGLVGVLLVLGAFAALLRAGLGIAARSRDPFALLLACAATLLLAVPAAVNAAVVMGCLPTKGLALPFLSYGRTSLLVCALSVGILLGVGRARAGAPHGGREA